MSSSRPNGAAIVRFVNDIRAIWEDGPVNLPLAYNNAFNLYQVSHRQFDVMEVIALLTASRYMVRAEEDFRRRLRRFRAILPARSCIADKLLGLRADAADAAGDPVIDLVRDVCAIWEDAWAAELDFWDLMADARQNAATLDPFIIAGVVKATSRPYARSRNLSNKAFRVRLARICSLHHSLRVAHPPASHVAEILPCLPYLQSHVDLMSPVVAIQRYRDEYVAEYLALARALAALRPPPDFPCDLRHHIIALTLNDRPYE
jgi:hypothetical protein